jgi:hypothetical protein
MNDRADDLTDSFIYSGKEGTFIITQELIFQATSKKSGGGMTSISGYNECRLTSYDFATGAIVGRVELGEQMESTAEIIAVINDQLWMYSIDPEIGLHCRNPKTFEIIQKESDIAALKGFAFSRPTWSQINSYYGFNVAKNKIILTDLQGVHYEFDPVAAKPVQTEDDMPNKDRDPDYLGSTVDFGEDSSATFNGSDDRKKLQWEYEDSTAKLPFLKPEFFIDRNPTRAMIRKQNRIDAIRNRRDSAQAKLDAIIAVHPVFRDENPSWGQMTREEQDMNSAIYQVKSDLRRADDELKRATEEIFDHEEYALGNTRMSCLIYSANTVQDTARAIITCVDCKSKKFTQRWQLNLSSFYFDPDKAEGAGVFDEGDPEFRYRWTDIHDGKFVMIAQLQMICIDMTTGKKLWEISL